MTAFKYKIINYFKGQNFFSLYLMCLRIDCYKYIIKLIYCDKCKVGCSNIKEKKISALITIYSYRINLFKQMNYFI